MKTLHVNLGTRSYPIYIGENLRLQMDLLLPHIASKSVAIVSNTTVAPLYLSDIAKLFSQHGCKVIEIILPDGEMYKNSETLSLIYDSLLKNRADRQTTVIALGGGVVGDITGYAAATYLRGVPFIQMPTTLLSQVDSSVGGKTGINHPLGKNMIGAFYQPKLVIADTATLHTLPPRELSAGLAEVIKYGLIKNQDFFVYLENNIEKIKSLETQAVMEAIYISCQTKSIVVANDEFETSGERAILNLGHTFGHAIEAGLGFGKWLHGEAVSAGMLLASRLSYKIGDLSLQDLQRIEALLKRAGLPTEPPHLHDNPHENYQQYLNLMQLDKKVQAGKIRLVLLKGIGKATMTDNYSSVLLQEVLSF